MLNNIEIENLIPHREKIKIISGVTDIQETTAVATAVVHSHWPLCGEDGVDALVLIEGVAQTAAVVEGYRRKQKGLEGVKGWLVGVKHAEFNVGKLPLGAQITIMIERKHSLENYGVVEGTVKNGDAILARMTLQAMILNKD
jgi:predicted hotdog family 3-hydroxylacyl-ACP dehydratase